MAEQSAVCNGDSFLALCEKKKLQRKMTKDYYCIGVEEDIGVFSNL